MPIESFDHQIVEEPAEQLSSSVEHQTIVAAAAPELNSKEGS
jgi:hypothetical protein